MGTSSSHESIKDLYGGRGNDGNVNIASGCRRSDAYRDNIATRQDSRRCVKYWTAYWSEASREATFACYCRIGVIIRGPEGADQLVRRSPLLRRAQPSLHAIRWQPRDRAARHSAQRPRRG